MSNSAATPAQDRATPAIEENSNLRPIDNEDVVSSPELTDAPPPEPGKTDEDAVTGPKEARADRVEALAENRLHKSKEELVEAQSTLAKPDAPVAPVETPPTDLNARVELKVNRENLSLTLAQRDELAAAFYEGDIADLTEKERNKYAQMEIADRKFEQRKLEARGAEPEQPRRQEPVQAQPKADEPKRETPDEKRERALEIIQLGGDKAEASRLMKEAEDERLNELLSARDAKQEAERRTALVDRNYAEGRAKAEEQYGELLSDVVVRGAVEAVHGGLQSTVIAQYISGQDAEIQMAFQESGITPAYLQSIRPEQATALYRDMISKGHKLPPPGDAYVVAAKVVTERLSGSTQPTPSNTPPSASAEPALVVDRSGRKEGLNTPERTSVPRQVPGRQGPPPSEQQRAASARRELQESRQR